MRQLFLISHHPLNKNFREDLSHKSVEVSITLPKVEVLPLEQHEGNDHFKQSLLVVYVVRLAIECGKQL